MSTPNSDFRRRVPPRSGRLLLIAGAAVLALAAAAYVAALIHYPRIQTLKGFDLFVYRSGGLLVRYDPSHLYSWQLAAGIRFTYTPFAALIFAALSFISFPALMDAATLLSIAALLLTIWVGFRELGWRGRERTGVAMLVAGVVFWSEPVQRTLFLGQIDLLLMALVVWDLSPPGGRRLKGAATGVAAAVKLTPLIFVLYLLLTRRVREAAVAAVTLAATVVIGFAALPAESAKWWLHGYFLQASRTGFVGDRANQSIRGLLTRLAGSVGAGTPLWIAAAVVVGIAGLAVAAQLHRRGRPFAGLVVCALTGLLISPISWDHHWVWIAPGLAVLLDAAVRGRTRAGRVAWSGAAAAVVVAFVAWPGPNHHLVDLLHGGLFWYAPGTLFGSGDNPAFAEYHWHGRQLLAGNLYVLVGMALFGVVVVACVRSLRSRSAAVGGGLMPAAGGR